MYYNNIASQVSRCVSVCEREEGERGKEGWSCSLELRNYEKERGRNRWWEKLIENDS